MPRLWETEVNATLHSGATRWKNAHILEWHDFSGCHDDWFVDDGFHLRTPGQHAYAKFVAPRPPRPSPHHLQISEPPSNRRG